ncbi:MAG: hypothetical protein K0S70_3274 [Microbacterium sp.]|jgi:hypothetical protein|nr:hypothetical protein [Microbacterium sp.]
MITSAGYDGSVNEPQWSDLLSLAGGRQYGVLDPASWRATIGAADREVRLSPGRGFGYGIRDASDAEESVTLAPVAAGSRWDLITMRRDWDENVSAFHVVQGSSAKEIPTRETTFAELDDQPLWLARVQAGFSQVRELIDLRVWGGDGGAFATDELVLQYLNRLGTRVRIGGREWSRVLDSLGTPSWAVTGAETRHNGNPGATLPGIDVPSGVLAVQGLQIKTGMLTAGTTSLYGNEYMPSIVFEQAFPNGILSVSVLPVFAGIASPLTPPIAPGVDGVSRAGFRVMYPGSSNPWVRSFLWTAIGY